MPQRGDWDAQLQELLASHVISGYALISHAGACLTSCGSLREELWSDEQQRLTPVAQQIHALFHTGTSATHLDVCGQQAVVIQQSDNSLYAVSRGKQLGLTAHYLPSGILVTVSSKPSMPHAVVPQVEAVCDVLRQP